MTAERSTDFARVARAIGFLSERVEEQPSLLQVAEAVGLSAGRTQRLFKRWAGVSPKRFLEYLTVEHAKEMLNRPTSVLDTSLEVGLSGPGRLHDHFVKLEAMSPGEYKGGGEGLELRYGRHTTPFGKAFLAASDRGIHRLAFLTSSGHETRRELDDLESTWPAADFRRDDRATGELIREIFDRDAEPSELLVRVAGTNFQLAVWKALIGVPRGALTSYEGIARAAGRPGANRAVGNALAANPVAYLIPCHRVIRKSGAIGNYRWGAARKRALIAWESARPA